MRNIEQPGQAEILHLPLVAIISDVADVAEKSIRRGHQMKIARDHSWIKIGRSVGIIPRDIEAAVIDDNVKIRLTGFGVLQETATRLSAFASTAQPQK